MEYTDEGEAGMTYIKGVIYISVETIKGLGKNPGLWIGTNLDTMVKVASFASKEKADMFCKWLDHFFGFDEREGAE